MGGGGIDYERNVRPAPKGRSYTQEAEDTLSTVLHASMTVKPDRRLRTEAKSPIVLALDVTGSMGNAPKVLIDKAALLSGQLRQCAYAEDPALSICGIGDFRSRDKGHLQVGDFCSPRSADTWWKRLWIEGKGGNGHRESYEIAAYYFAHFCEMPAAETPFLIFTGDEAFYEELFPSDLRQLFGGQHAQNVSAKQVFTDLRRTFKDNVFLIHRPYQEAALDASIVDEWTETLGMGHVVRLPRERSGEPADKAIADILLGIIALRTGARTLEDYQQDLRTARDEPQTETRIRLVSQALAPVVELGPMVGRTRQATPEPPAERMPPARKKSKERWQV